MPTSAETQAKDKFSSSITDKTEGSKILSPSEILDILIQLSFAMYSGGQREQGLQLGTIARQWHERTEYIAILETENEKLRTELLALAVKTAETFSKTDTDSNINK
jgi:hypothetical protein